RPEFAGEKDAYEAMSEAVFYRKGIGDDQKPKCTSKQPCDAVTDTEYFIDTFKTKKPQEAANAMFALTTVYEKQNDSDKVIRHLHDYLHQFGDKGGADRVVIAHAKIGNILWH